MNDLVIIQTAQGLAVHLEETLRDVTHKNGVVIGYDGRHNSRRCVFLSLLDTLICLNTYYLLGGMHYHDISGS
jgi:hypothetical protein